MSGGAPHVGSEQLGPIGGRAFRYGLGAGVVLMLAAVVLAAMTSGGDWHRVQRAYLAAYMFVLAISLGSLFFVMLQHATRAGWSVTVRRIHEGMALNLVWLPLGFIPIWLLTVFGDMYPWTHPAEGDQVLAHKEAYLNIPFWTIRAVVFLGLWALLARYYFKQSTAQDGDGDPDRTSRMQFWAPLGLLAYAFSQTFASIDWVKSLEPHWFSTMFGVYFFAVSCCASFSVAIIIAYLLKRSGKVQNAITTEHFQDLGKLLFAFGIVFWAYIAFCQYMLIWYANIPEETGWYIVRREAGWEYVSWLLTIGHFFIPLVFFISRHPKRMEKVSAIFAAWMLFMVWVDVYWLTMPVIPPGIENMTTMAEVSAAMVAEGLGFNFQVIDILFPLAFLGLYLAGLARTLGRCSLVPHQDPRLHEAVAFENT